MGDKCDQWEVAFLVQIKQIAFWRTIHQSLHFSLLMDFMVFFFSLFVWKTQPDGPKYRHHKSSHDDDDGVDGVVDDDDCFLFRFHISSFFCFFLISAISS